MSRRTRHSILPNRSTTSKYEQSDRFARLANQNYEDILRKCTAKNILFEDPEFPATDATLFYTKKPPRPFVWKRPKEICNNPKFFVGGASRLDLNQGMLGDCWFLAAVASLAGERNLLQRVVPVQSFTDRYCGLFRFQFWHQGKWLEVVVDDRLPTYNNKLVFLHSDEKNEFWSALLEKAYAKLQGSYEALKGGQTSEAMVDFTGGVTETFDLKKAPKDLFNIMRKACSKGSLMGCSIGAKPSEIEAKQSNGLVKGHAYSVTAVREVDIQTQRLRQKIPMVRVRNPWGNEREWTGRWSDKSSEWALVSDKEKEELGLTFEDDGEFWMMFEDFVSNFERLEICNLGVDSQGSEGARSWESRQESGAWVRGCSAGGCRNFPISFHTNPQYRMTLTDPDDEDDEDTCGIVIALMQKNRRNMKKEGKQNLTIGFSIYKLEDPNTGPLDREYFNYHASTARSPSFINSREIIGRFKLPPGSYVVVPSTFNPNLEADFLLRIFTEKPFDSRPIDAETGFDEKQLKREPEPTQEDQTLVDKMKQTFLRLAGVDEEIDAFELQEILSAGFKKELQGKEFSIDACRSLVAMYDGDLSGKLGFDDFTELWSELRKWRGVFGKYDQDNSGYFSSFELRQALHATGFTVSNKVLQGITARFNNKNGHIMFDDFVSCLARLKTMINSFKGDDDQSPGFGPSELDRFVMTVMYS